jgi:hypothetical protein
MRLYLVGMSSMEKLADHLLQYDQPVQVIVDAHRTGEIACGKRQGAVLCNLPPSYANQEDCERLLQTWNQGRYSLVQVGGIWNFDGANVLIAIPNTYWWRIGGWLATAILSEGNRKAECLMRLLRTAFLSEGVCS